jgi:hypothetical protein
MRCWQAAVGASATVLALVMGQTLVPEPPEPRSGESLGVRSATPCSSSHSQTMP